MSREGLVSITIPFLDSERFLREAVESVASQSYTQWELLLVDDGSTDRSTSIAMELARERPGCIRYLEHPNHENRGMAATRNLGLRYSAGEYIARLDSDDRWDSEHLETLVSAMRDHPRVAMTFGPMRVWHTWKDRSGIMSGDWVQRFDFTPNTVLEPPTLIPHLLSGRNDPQGVLVRKTHMENVGGYDESIHLYEDMTLYCRIALHYPTCVVDRCTYWYRRHPDSFCSVARAQGSVQHEHEQFLRWFEAHISQSDLADREVHRALDRARWRNRHPGVGSILDLPYRVRRAVARRLGLR